MTHDMAEDGRSLPAELTTDDINNTINCEPRIADLRVAEALGFERPRVIRELIERHREALERFGEVSICRTVRQNSEHIGEVSVTVTENTEQKGRGRPGRAYWLNKRQALYLCTKSETPRATEVVIQMVEVFDAWTAGHLPPPPPPAGGAGALPPAPPPEEAEPPFCRECPARYDWMRGLRYLHPNHHPVTYLDLMVILPDIRALVDKVMAAKVEDVERAIRGALGIGPIPTPRPLPPPPPPRRRRGETKSDLTPAP